MSLQAILEGLSKEQRVPFLRKAYRPERQEVAEALLGELELGLRMGSAFYIKNERREFDEIVGNLIRQAEEAGDKERAEGLRFRQVTSYFYANDIESAAKSSGNPALVEKVIKHYRKEFLNKAEMVIRLLEHLGRKDEAREYSLEAAEALRKTNGGITASDIYLRLGMNKEAVEVRLSNTDFEGAIELAQEHLDERELPQFYKRVFKAAEGKGYDSGFPVQVKAAELLEDGKLERKTKKKYVDWIMNSTDKAGYLGLIRNAGTKKQLREMHERVVVFYQQENSEGVPRGEPKDLAKAAEEAYQDTRQVRYAITAMETYEKMGNFAKALEFARIAGSNKIPLLEEIIALETKS